MTPPILAYYGDDLTGSTDVMEALELRGVPTVLFTGIPSAAQATRFPDKRAIGLAGTSRSETPDWMDEHLPALLSWLKSLQPSICHYKVCSTFDSAPHVGSIGRALDIGAGIFGQSSTLLVVGAPELRRYTAFGHLFAGFREASYRIDRHPVMSRHPVTPMDEADLRIHLGRQTDKAVGLIDLTRLKQGINDAQVDAIFENWPIVMMDVLDAETQRLVGSQLWRLRERFPFVVGSSGVEYALTADGAGTPLSGGRCDFVGPGSRGPIAVVSGSCSPTTASQIQNALQHGFAGIAVDALRLSTNEASQEIARAVEAGSAAIGRGLSPILYTALGSETVQNALSATGHRVGAGLGRILAALVARHGLRRAVVAGGDTSSHALSELGIFALECLMPLPHSPGSPLCIAHLAAGSLLEIAFKGGQVGKDDYFRVARDI